MMSLNQFFDIYSTVFSTGFSFLRAAMWTYLVHIVIVDNIDIIVQTLHEYMHAFCVEYSISFLGYG